VTRFVRSTRRDNRFSGKRSVESAPRGTGGFVRIRAKWPNGMSLPDERRLGDTFEGVLGAARGHEEWAWRLLYRGLAPKVRGYLRARERIDADDLLGEVFVQVVRDLPRFDGTEREFEAWVMTIAHNRLIDAGRRRARRPLSVMPADQVVDACGGDVEDEALIRIGNERVHRALARLSEDQRSVILLRVVSDLTVEQVALALHKTPGAVKALQRRGLAALKDQFPQTGRTLMPQPGAGASR
jgi:RNA polymerase sigma-70 factor, ECF subfamily